MSKQTDFSQIKRIFKVVNKFMLLAWRLGFGPMINSWPEEVGRIMVMTHTGRKSGVKHQTPVNYTLFDGDVYCTAMPGADWYRNVKANPQVEVWLPNGRWSGMAEEVPLDMAHLPVFRQVLIDSGFAASTFVGVHPRKITDADLADIGRGYHLFRIQRSEAIGIG
jgi:deazaflavin-dependent oxidoreductase (nitroreductase family)